MSFFTRDRKLSPQFGGASEIDAIARGDIAAMALIANLAKKSPPPAAKTAPPRY